MTSDKTSPGEVPLDPWGYESIGLLLEVMEAVGCVSPVRYFPSDDSPEQFAAARVARDKLSFSISWAFTREDVHLELVSDSRAKKRLKKAAEIRGQLQRAIQRLEDDPGLQDMVDARLTASELEGDTGMDSAIDGLHQVQRAVILLCEELPPAAPFSKWPVTRQQALFSELQKAFREGFDVSPDEEVKRTSNGYGGPLPTFIRKAFEMGNKAAPTGDAMTQALRRYILKRPEDKT